MTYIVVRRQFSLWKKPWSLHRQWTQVLVYLGGLPPHPCSGFFGGRDYIRPKRRQGLYLVYKRYTSRQLGDYMIPIPPFAREPEKSLEFLYFFLGKSWVKLPFIPQRQSTWHSPLKGMVIVPSTFTRCTRTDPLNLVGLFNVTHKKCSTFRPRDLSVA